MNTTIVNVALPSIAEDLSVGMEEAQLVVLGYLLALGALPEGLVRRDAFVLAVHDAFYATICVLAVLASLASDRWRIGSRGGGVRPEVVQEAEDFRRTEVR